MEIGQLHVMEPLDADRVEAGLRERLGGGLLPYAALGVSIAGPWRPADVWPGAGERLCWTASFDIPGDALLTDEAASVLAAGSIARRHAPLHPAELIAPAFASALVLVHSDAARLAYVAVYRERHLRMSLMLHDSVRLVRCDGTAVVVQAPPRSFPERDRAGVLLAGLHSWLREPIFVDAEERMFLADQLAALAEAPVEWLVRHGRWTDEPPVKQRASAR